MHIRIIHTGIVNFWSVTGLVSNQFAIFTRKICYLSFWFTYEKQLLIKISCILAVSNKKVYHNRFLDSIIYKAEFIIDNDSLFFKPFWKWLRVSLIRKGFKMLTPSIKITNFLDYLPSKSCKSVMVYDDIRCSDNVTLRNNFDKTDESSLIVFVVYESG